MAALLALVVIARAGDDAEFRFLRAWYALADPEQTAAAEAVFRELFEADGTEPELKARCLLGLAACARKRHDEPAARAALKELVRRWPDSEAAKRARLLLDQSGVVEGVVNPRVRQYVDLDTGAVFESRQPAAGVEAELRGASLLVVAEVDPEFAAVASPEIERPWRRLTTSEGRTSWVQVLDDGARPIVRYVTSWDPPAPAPRDVACVGTDDGIAVWFAPARSFARYHLERCDPDGRRSRVDTVATPPLLDRTAERGVRYLYLVAGETAEGERGLAATLEGTRASRGVVSGKTALERGGSRSFDFLRGEVVADGDVTLTGIYGNRSAAAFVDAYGRYARAVASGANTTAWDAKTSDTNQIPPGSTFLVPLRGGGVARCRLEMLDGRGGPEVLLHYEACGDGPRLPQPVRLAAERDARGARVTVEVDAPWRVVKVEANDFLGTEPPRPLEVVDGVARDPGAAEGRVREYRAVAVDPHGRRSATAQAQLALFPPGPQAGEFRFHYQQGYSLETRRLVPAAQADVVFTSCAGGIASIHLTAPGGIVNLERVVPADVDLGGPEAIFDLVVGASRKLRLKRDARGDSRNAASDVFLLKTRHGGWAKLVITHRGREGGWTEYLATVKFVYCADAPRFSDEPGDDVDGVLLSGLAARLAVLSAWRDGWSALRNDPERLRALGLDEAGDEGVLPDADAVQEVLTARHAHFSFVFGIRDDPELRKTGNDWCLQYSSDDSMGVRIASDDRSTITDLGRRNWDVVSRLERIPEGGASRAATRFGHTYLIHTHDADENFFALLRITALRSRNAMAFEWVAFRHGRWTTSPRLPLDEETSDRLRKLIEALPATREERGLASEAAGAVLGTLRGATYRIGVAETHAVSVLRDLATVAGVRIRMEAERVPEVSLLGDNISGTAILDEIATQTGLTWRIDPNGTVVFSR